MIFNYKYTFNVVKSESKIYNSQRNVPEHKVLVNDIDLFNSLTKDEANKFESMWSRIQRTGSALKLRFYQDF